MTGVRTGTLYWLPIILDDADLDPTETLLLVALADHVDAEDRCYVGISRLATRARVSYSTARRKLAELERRGVITRDRRRRDDGNLSVYEYVLIRQPSLNLSGGDAPAPTQVSADHRSPGWALTIAHPGERAEPPRVEPPSVEPFGVTPSATTPPRPRDEVWDTTLAVCGIDPSSIPRSARGAYNRAVADLRNVDASPDEIIRRGEALALKWGIDKLTPTSLARHWAEFPADQQRPVLSTTDRNLLAWGAAG